MRWALSAADEEAVAAWIRRTATHHLKASSEEEGSAAMTTATATSTPTPTPTTSGDLALFLDIDLAILGARPPDYARYCERVRLEYHQYDDAAFRKGRPAVMKTFLEHDPLYFTTAMRSALEARARANVAAEIAQLSSSG